MKIVKSIAILLLCFYFISNLSAADKNDLIWRLKQLNGNSYRASISYLEKQNGAKFAPGNQWSNALAKLENGKSNYLKLLSENDEKTKDQVSALFAELDKTMLSNPLVKNKEILVISRHLGDKARKRMGAGAGLAPSNFQNNSEIQSPKTGWDNEFTILSNLGSSIQKKIIYKPQEKVIINDPELHFDGERVLYSSIGTNDRWHLFELNLKTGETKQVTPADYKDFDSFDGCYTADGKYIFCSTGTFLGLPCTDGGNKMCGLFLYDPVTKKTRQLTFDQDSNWDPVMMNNGKIMYQRWEYADIPHSNSRIIFTMNPDGTEQKAYYGSNSYFPASLWGTRPVPGKDSQFVGIASGHHSTTRSGGFLLFNTDKGRKEADGVVGQFPYFGQKVIPLERDRLPDGVFPHFLHPYPLDEKYHIVVMKPTPTSLWGVYLMDTFNNVTLLKEDEGVAFLNPIILEKRKTPAVIPSRINQKSSEATVFIQNIYVGDGLKGIPVGTVKKLRIGSYNFHPFGQGGLLGTIGMDGPWDIKQIEGEVDVEPDGSVMFKIPVNTPIFVQPLDKDGNALQLMRSWFTGMPGETVSCIGCHEDQRTIPQPRANMASKKAPQTIKPWYGKERGFSFKHEIQPILDKYCIQCHDREDSKRPYLKGDKMVNNWISHIGGRAPESIGGKFSESYAQLHGYVRRPGIESDMDMLPPMEFHASQTELMQILNKGHYGVNLDKEATQKLACWIDFNAPYYGRRQDIPEATTRSTVINSNELREAYAEMFQIKNRSLSWLPDISHAITPVKAVKKEVDKGIETLKDWPVKDPENLQINQLGYFQKSIELKDGLVLKLIRIPAGSFLMGSTRNNDEMPVSEVAIKKDFWIGQFEITNEQYVLYDPKHDSRLEDRHGYQFGRRGYPLNEPKQPVVRISWEEANKYCKWLSEKTGKEFSLPTEAQWEWACRAGSDTPYSFGNLNSDFTKFANLGDIKLSEYAACTSYKFYESARVIDNANRFDDWVPRDTTFNDGCFVSEYVGKYRANRWDLYDMHGNVWEWTRSAYHPYPYNDADGRNDVDAKKRVVRGGSWYDRPFKATSSFRLPYEAYQKVFNVGFRVVMEED